LITVEDKLKNKKLTDFDGLREFVIANSVRGLRKFKKQKSEGHDRILEEF